MGNVFISLCEYHTVKIEVVLLLKKACFVIKETYVSQTILEWFHLYDTSIMWSHVLKFHFISFIEFFVYHKTYKANSIVYHANSIVHLWTHDHVKQSCDVLRKCCGKPHSMDGKYLNYRSSRRRHVWCTQLASNLICPSLWKRDSAKMVPQGNVWVSVSHDHFLSQYSKYWPTFVLLYCYK